MRAKRAKRSSPSWGGSARGGALGGLVALRMAGRDRGSRERLTPDARLRRDLVWVDRSGKARPRYPWRRGRMAANPPDPGRQLALWKD